MGEVATATVFLKRGREKALAGGHPWVFSGAVAREDGPSDAPLARVLSSEGEFLGLGFYSAGSRIRVRLVRGDEGPVDRAFFRDRIESAVQLRLRLLPPETTGYRLLNAEGDFLPGWTVDRFGDCLVSQITSAGLEALRGEAYGALRELLPGKAILQRGGGTMRRREGLAGEDEWIAGEPRGESEFLESGLRFTAELEGGQKTGFYCDQRPNRRLAESLAGGARVLDLFAHTGAFSVYALRGGAAEAVAVESSSRLVARGRRHLTANGLASDRMTWIEGNAFEEVRRLEGRFDLVVCDPPPLVRSRKDRDAGARAYKDLNRQALLRLAPGGLLLTFSCSAAVDQRLLRQILYAATVEAERQVVLLRPLGPGDDHPVAVTHPEGEYLKGWLLEAR